MAKSDLLKEAIADAKAVKETALANAKIALQEAFMPRMENMLKTSMENQMMDEDEEEMPAEEPVDGMGADEEEMPEGGDDFNWTDDHLSASVGGNDYDFTVGMSGGDEDEMPAEEMPEEEPASDEDMSAEYTEGMNMNNMDDELDLQEIIRELEGDADAMGMTPPEEEDIEAIREYFIVFYKSTPLIIKHQMRDEQSFKTGFVEKHCDHCQGKFGDRRCKGKKIQINCTCQ